MGQGPAGSIIVRASGMSASGSKAQYRTDVRLSKKNELRASKSKGAGTMAGPLEAQPLVATGGGGGALPLPYGGP
jgi:hypothetical protein